ncbi:MAG: amidohydrolase family protein, partial [Candidatus Binatia bacterium]
PSNWQLPYEMVSDVIKKYPQRFRGLAGIDPNEGMDGVRKLEYAIRELGFIGAHLYPHWFELAPDHRKYYPFYAKCVELNVPIQMQVGHCLLYSKERPLKSVGRPITLDTIACDFPELKLIGIHTGWPWVEEMISVAWKHPNVYIGTDAYAPKYWKPELIHFIDSWGQTKVLFGTDFPVIEFRRATAEVDELNFKAASKEHLMWKNAARVYDLKPADGFDWRAS